MSSRASPIRISGSAAAINGAEPARMATMSGRLARQAGDRIHCGSPGADQALDLFDGVLVLGHEYRPGHAAGGAEGDDDAHAELPARQLAVVLALLRDRPGWSGVACHRFLLSGHRLVATRAARPVYVVGKATGQRRDRVIHQLCQLGKALDDAVKAGAGNERRARQTAHSERLVALNWRSCHVEP